MPIQPGTSTSATTTPTTPTALGEPFTDPYIDVDEWREAPARRYVHGGFRGTETRFSFHLPPAATYQGRFFQYITPVPDSEHLCEGAQGEEDKIGFAVESGAIFVETNGGGPRAGDPFSGIDPLIGAYRANAAVAALCRSIAADTYGPHRTYGYAYGGSGGAFRTIGAAENTTEVWDGFVPYVIGSPMSIPNCFTARMHALRLLRGHFEAIDDAMSPGGSANPFSDLSPEQAEALREVTQMGFPIRSWFGHRTMGMHGLAALYPGLRAIDPTYFDDFWSVPGYLGADPASSVHRDRVRLATRVAEVLDAAALQAAGLGSVQHAGTATGAADDAWLGAGEQGLPVAVRLAGTPSVDPQSSELLVTSGSARGSRLIVLELHGDLAVLGPSDPTVLRGLRVGDELVLDNSGFLAMQTYHRHQVPTHDFEVWDQFRAQDGTALYPQRPHLVGPIFAGATGGAVQSGHFHGRMIVVECLLDREAYPWQADWYRSRVQEHLADSGDDRFRLWMVDNALHGDFERQEHPNRTVSYLGVLQHALRDLAAWTEQGIAPAPSTTYTINAGQVSVPAGLCERGGVQPTVTLRVQGQDSVHARTGETVTLQATVETREDHQVIGLDWDLTGRDGLEPVESSTAGPLGLEQQVVFTEPGLYFPTVRVVVQRSAAPSSRFGRLQNIARVRVVVR